jgi:hypothetical protein
MDAVKGLLLTLRFVLEISALVALAHWGFTTGGTVENVVLGVGAPTVAIAVWALFVSPKARFGSAARRAVFEAVVFGAAVVALLAADQTTWAVIFAAVAIVDSVLVRVLGA